jgi:hypothetical protein
MISMRKALLYHPPIEYGGSGKAFWHFKTAEQNLWQGRLQVDMKRKMMLFHEDGTLPTRGEIFVFGSNLAGRHGAGAARVALQFGAEFGKGNGLVGNSYAIPTKDEKLKTLPIDRIINYISVFIQFTRQNPDKSFFVTRVGCGLAGYQNSQIAPLFRGAVNCSFPDTWQYHL